MLSTLKGAFLFSRVFLDLLLEWIKPLEMLDHLVQWLNHIFNAHAVFRAKDGRTGVDPAELREGDRVVIFDGGKIHSILRYANAEDVKDYHNRWKPVGYAYLLGWMDGSYFGHEIVDEIERTTTENAHSFIIMGNKMARSLSLQLYES